MTVQQWLESEVKYGRKVLDAGLEGTRSGREAFLEGKSLTPYLNESVQKAFIPAAIGTCIGVLGSAAKQKRPVGRVLAFGLVGGAIGFGLGIAWESRHLTMTAVSSALKKISRVCDEHWLERHPIDYA
jgi:hypothetical protein